jgi:hypothetical protein
VYWSTLQDAWRAERWLDKRRIWFKGPGWRPADVEARYPATKTKLQHFTKYEIDVPPAQRYSAFFQFVCAMIATALLLASAAYFTLGELYVAAREPW